MRFTKFALLLCISSIFASASSQAIAAVSISAPSSNIDKSLNITISPLPIRLNVKPGASVSTDLRILNDGANSETLKLSLKTFTAEGPSGQVILHNPTPSDNYISWVHFDRDVFNAPAGQWQTIKMTIDVPKNAAYGYYYAVQVGLASPPTPTAGAAQIQGAVAIFVLLNAEAPGATRRIEVSKFAADHSSYEFLPARFTVQVRNTGNVHTAPHGNIFIKRGGKQLGVLDVNPAQGMVLPKSNREFSASWDDGFPVYTAKLNDSGQPIKDAKGNDKMELKWDFSDLSKLRFGHYTADLFLVYNDGQRDVPITGTLSFWVIPWRVIFVVLVVLAGPAIFVYLLMRRRYGRRLRAFGGSNPRREK